MIANAKSAKAKPKCTDRPLRKRVKTEKDDRSDEPGGPVQLDFKKYPYKTVKVSSSRLVNHGYYTVQRVLEIRDTSLNPKFPTPRVSRY